MKKGKKQQEEEVMTEEQKKMMRTQDIGYVEMKRVAEAKVCQILQTLSSEKHSVFNLCSL